jgi:UDP-N-acetylglucosamine--N-acetylmuramyl-(pentapeptide) pyrophosphoryl-undecaprenol N-acetylglucosamine transferase
MKVILAGGGTGGHLYPAIAVAEKLKERNIDFLFLVSNRGIERKILTKLGFDFIEQETVAFKGKNLVSKFRAIIQLLIEISKTSKFVNRLDKVILFGGFASASAGAVSRLKKVEYYIHEQNSVMGMVNSFFAEKAKKVFLSFPDTIKSKGNCITIGNPVRQEFSNFEPKKELGKNILIIGGSQGSRAINNLIVDSAEEILSKGFYIRHQTGEKLYNEVLEAYESKNLRENSNVEIYAYIDSMKDAYDWADIIISRAGSGSVFEIMYAKRPAIFIPFKAASDNHQMLNAQAANKIFGALIMEESSSNSEILMSNIEKIINNYDEIYLKLKEIKFVDTAGRIIKEMNIG